jgi:hypothetical protein
MDNLDTQIALVQARLTSAVKSGEPEDSPLVRQMDARLERMRRLWTTHRRIRLDLETSEGDHVSRVN